MSTIQNAFSTITPVLIEGHKAKAYLDKVAKFSPAGLKANEDIEEMLEMVFGKSISLFKHGSLAIITIRGIIGNELTELEKMMGCVDVDDVEEMLEDCERDPAIKHILFVYNSPGGTVTGVPELANRIAACKKHTIGYTRSQACSAAFWCMSQCDDVYASGSSTVGSIGVYIAFLNESKAYEMEGYSMEVISAGWAKAAGFPGTNMSPEQKNLLLSGVNSTHNQFQTAIQRKRTLADVKDMQGQCWSGTEAAAKMLITGIKDTLDDVLKTIGMEIYMGVERQEPVVQVDGQYAADVTPEQGEKDEFEPIKDLKKKNKKSSDDEDEDDVDPKEIPTDSCTPVETDGKG